MVNVTGLWFDEGLHFFLSKYDCMYYFIIFITKKYTMPYPNVTFSQGNFYILNFAASVKIK